jgi:RecB family endonuclease NucS
MHKHLELEAIDALRETLRQISVIKVKNICVDRHGNRSNKTILSQIEIYGHAHLIACKVVSTCDLPHLNEAVRELQEMEKERGVVVKRILIAPAMSEEAQTLCRENNIGFLDLEGNARLYLDEVFIVKRSLHQKKIPPPAETMPKSETARFAQVA